MHNPRNDGMNESKQARRHDELIDELLDSSAPKTEREHAAAREIERLRSLKQDRVNDLEEALRDTLRQLQKAINGERAALAVEVLVRKYDGAMPRERLREALLEAYLMGAQNILGQL